MHELISKAEFDAEVGILTPGWASATGVTVNQIEFPVLDLTFHHTTPLRLRLVCDNWPELPPSVELCDEGGSFLPAGVLPAGGIFNHGSHEKTGRPFVCMRGTREFHTHSGHLNERWEGYKGQEGMGIVGIAVQIGRAWKKEKK